MERSTLSKTTFNEYIPTGFTPININREFLKDHGINYPVSNLINKELISASRRYKLLLDNQNLLPDNKYIELTTDPEKELEVHNYTGLCPVNVLEISPSSGSCTVGCQYCLVTDGKHIQKIFLYTNYTERLARSLEKNRDKKIFYYFSPKTEAFSETHLTTGMAHSIIKTFIRHYEKYPDSLVRLFIATKAGPQELEYLYKGDSLFYLMSLIANKIQVNGSIGIMPPYLRQILEPNAATISERLEILIRCRDMGIWAESVLCQPLFLPYLQEDILHKYMEDLQRAGIKNIKPEFFTAEINNIVLVAQYIHHFDPDKTGEFFYPYLKENNQSHIKQRFRLAPDRDICRDKLKLISTIAGQYGITLSICNWVKKELGQNDPSINIVDKKSAKAGYKCLGYQSHLFDR